MTARIVSLVSGATEILFALGLGHAVVGVSHDSDYPAEARNRPSLTSIRAGGVVELDAERLAAMAPDLIFADGAPDAAGRAGAAIRRAVGHLRPRPHVYPLAPRTVGDVLSGIKTIGDATGAQARARDVIDALKARIDRAALAAAGVGAVPRVLCLEGLDPPRTAGGWASELVGLAGGRDDLSGIGRPSRRVAWDDIAAYAPEVVLVVSPGIGDTPAASLPLRTAPPTCWNALAAVRSGRVFAVDTAYVTRPGPRLADGLEAFASILHPALAGDTPCGDAARSALRSVRDFRNG